MATYNNKIEVVNGNSTDVFHPETNTAQVYDFNNAAWLGSIIGVLNTLSTTKKASIVEALNELAGVKAPLNSPTFTGVPTAPTASIGTNTTQIANTAFVTTAIANIPPSQDIDIVDEIPSNLDGKRIFFKKQGGTTNAPGKPTIQDVSDTLTSHTIQMEQFNKRTKGTVYISDYQHLVVDNDWTNAIKQALLAVIAGGELRFHEGVFNHRGIVITKSVNIRGCGKRSTVLVNIGTGDSIEINSAERGTFRDIAIFGDVDMPYAPNAVSKRGIIFNTCAYWNFDNIWMQGHGSWFFYSSGNGHVNNINITNSEFEYGKKGAIHFVQPNYENQINGINIQNCNMSGFGGNIIELWGSALSVTECSVQASKERGVVISGHLGDMPSNIKSSNANAIRIENNYFELCDKGFIFLSSMLVEEKVNERRYLSAISIRNNYGAYGQTPGSQVNPSEYSLVEVQAPLHDQYTDLHISGFVYMGNQFSSNGGNGIFCKAILNGNNVLSYYDIIQINTEVYLAPEYYINLGRAKILNPIKKQYLHGSRHCINTKYDMVRSENIRDSHTLIFDIGLPFEDLINLSIPISTDSKKYNILMYVAHRNPTVNAFTDYTYTAVSAKDAASSNFLVNFHVWAYYHNLFKGSDYYIALEIWFNDGEIDLGTYFHVGNIEIERVM